MVGHDHRPLAIAPGDDDHQVALVRQPLLVSDPAIVQLEVKIGSPGKGQIADQRFSRHPRGLDLPGVVIEQIIAEVLQVATVMMGQRLLRRRVAHHVGVVLGAVAALCKKSDGLPVRDFKRPA